MVVRLIRKVDPLVADAAPAKPLYVEPSAEELLAWWSAFPSPGAKKKLCKHCGDLVTVGCAAESHARCMNFAMAKRRQEKRHV